MSSRKCLHDFRYGELRMQSSRPTRGNSLLFIRVTVVFELRVFDVAVTFVVVLMMSKYKIFTALPLRRHTW